MDELTHDRAQESFTDYQEKTLPEVERKRLEAHLAACPDCSREWEGFQQMMSGLAGLKQADHKPAPDLVGGTADKIHRRTRGLFFRRANKIGVRYELIAIVLLGLIGIAYWALHSMWPQGGEPFAPPPGSAPASAPQKKSQAPSDEPTVGGRVVLAYAFTLSARKPEGALSAQDAEALRPHLERILLTRSGSLGPWEDTPTGARASYSVPAKELPALYKDLGQSFSFTEEKLPVTVPTLDAPATGSLLLPR